MLKKRIIPVILLRNGLIVQSRNFKRYQIIGTPTAAVERFSSWNSDELIYLDISPVNYYDLKRDDLNHPEFTDIIDIIKLVSQRCRMPLTFGGGIRTKEDAYLRLKNGADKVSINTLAIDDVTVVTDIAKSFGSQCVVISIDVKLGDDGKYYVYKRGKEPTFYNPVQFAKMIEDAGAGEILLNSVDLDGTGRGFDLKLINDVVNSVNIPVIALGGAGKWEDFYEVFSQTNASAAAAANIFHHYENSVHNCRKFLYEKNIPVRRLHGLSIENNNI